MIAVTIDGRRIETAPGRTILHVAREHGIPIPTLCYHEALGPFGACRLCVVEVETPVRAGDPAHGANGPRGRQIVASCAYPCADGLVVHTHSKEVLRSRRITLELLMATSAHVLAIRQLADELQVGQPRFTLEPDDCILCGLCVRACREIVGVAAISVINRGIEKRVSPPFRVASDACIGCGTCVLICPTGAITLADVNPGLPSVHAQPSPFEVVDCRICGHHDLEPHFVDLTLLTEPVVGTEAAI